MRSPALRDPARSGKVSSTPMKNAIRLRGLDVVAPVLVCLLGVSSYTACGGDDATSAPSSDDAGSDGAADAGPDGTGFPPSLEVDAGAPAHDSGAVRIEAGPPANGPGGDLDTIYCGLGTCQIPNSACCVYRELGDAGYKYSFTCSGSDTCPVLDGGVAGVALRCSGQENCGGGKLCCFSDQGTGSRADCMATCGGAVQMCNGRIPPANCPALQSCTNANDSSLGLPTTYGTCGDRPM